MDDNLKLTELQMYSIITVTSSFLTKEKIYIFRAALTILFCRKIKRFIVNVQKGCLISISKILEIDINKNFTDYSYIYSDIYNKIRNRFTVK